ncbi:hypothetical protein CLV65_1275 [Pseudoscardovia suis]|uniref:Uncharacterized protein n=1 Tax=Pseudoscardovia suis TaxID=987063 RepID=A0A261EQG6_9BIFI|nr:hypothetical protein PSSU_1595 [Pseudoscardovia suis]PJJ66023.1 hypothetical protein CLV65_1275 [Pseudoscardovia suis]
MEMDRKRTRKKGQEKRNATINKLLKLQPY